MRASARVVPIAVVILLLSGARGAWLFRPLQPCQEAIAKGA